MRIDEALERAVSDSPLIIMEVSVDAAQRWVWRAHNHINRKAPHLARLMIVRRGRTITIVAPALASAL